MLNQRLSFEDIRCPGIFWFARTRAITLYYLLLLCTATQLNNFLKINPTIRATAPTPRIAKGPILLEAMLTASRVVRNVKIQPCANPDTPPATNPTAAKMAACMNWDDVAARYMARNVGTWRVGMVWVAAITEKGAH